jgi:predicted CoA-substrate-specific enzyme activase
MSNDQVVIGIDIGSVSIAIVAIDYQKNVQKTGYRFHDGDIQKNLDQLLAEFADLTITGIAATTSTPETIAAQTRCDNRIALIEATRQLHGNVGAILTIGGETFGLVTFHANGTYRNYRTNTSCAAGTGSFLDQQAGRLNLGGIEELSRTAASNKGLRPKIASRCAVFAKTDIIHAQQEGYTLEEVCDGLCHGLAKNIVDTLLTGEKPPGVVLLSGGVAGNQRVVQYIGELAGVDVLVDPYAPHHEAMGAALDFMESQQAEDCRDSRRRFFPKRLPANRLTDLFLKNETARQTHYPPLRLTLSDYPEFTSNEKYTFAPNRPKFTAIVEVDIYQPLSSGDTHHVYLGMDIGSTSTKAVLLDTDKSIVAGFYTQTMGKPIDAVCALFEAIDNMQAKRQVALSVISAGTTGSGRKFVGKIVGADLVLDEITAHARAAFELNPNVDTIIEIGGQDAKFTTLRNGAVTFSFMNTICAAGTGSFIEEQARKLACPLNDYSTRAENVEAPLSSDRCTVFMERDINHYLNEGYRVEEVMASVLHSVRENYLRKVAIEGEIGNTVLFQGATAKNKALVAAFEQRLNKPILVSKYCHLTGALGAALMLAEEGKGVSRFRGIDFYRKDVPSHSEVCDLCFNHCKLTLFGIDGEHVAYGCLCGREYHSKKRTARNPSGFDLIASRNRLRRSIKPPTPTRSPATDITIGLPAGLYLYDTLHFWESFFHVLGYRTTTSRAYKTALKDGKQLSGAEFCAPITAMHGHVDYLLKKADVVFLPFYLEQRQKSREWRRQYCYYSQFMPALANLIAPDERDRLLTPLVHYLYTPFHAKKQLYKMLRSIDPGIGFFDVISAFDRATEIDREKQRRLKDLYKKTHQQGDDVSVTLLGRPYSILSQSMNKGIPDLFAGLGVKAFFQDMLPDDPEALSSIKQLLKEVHWNYGAAILEAAEKTARTDGAYPVLVTSFKCAPDSFIKDYFQQLMAAHGKPYLILELDEHDSNVGYETRIEAAVRAFRNHAARRPRATETAYEPLMPTCTKKLSNKTLVLPNWDSLTCQLLASVLEREGIRTIVMEETETSIRKSLRFNTGQCLPVNAITQGFVDSVRAHGLNPADTALWMVSSNTCSLRLYPHHVKTLLSKYGDGMEKAGIYVGEISLADVSMRAAYNAYLAYMFAGLVRKIGCKLRPYEKTEGRVDRAIADGMVLLSRAFAGDLSKEDALKRTVSAFKKIEIVPHERPKVAILGDLYVRDNRAINQDLIHFIEKHGGEVITTPYLSYAKMLAGPYFKKWFNEGLYLNLLSYKTLLTVLQRREKYYSRFFEPVLKEPEIDYDQPPERILTPYNIALENTGETMDSIMKIYYIKKYTPDVSLFVQTSPSFCCPSLITEAMAEKIERDTNVPIVSITYDGTGGNKNDALIPYLKYAAQAQQESAIKSAM